MNQSDAKNHVGAALEECIINRMPQEADRCEVVVITRDELARVMSLCFLDGLDAGLDALQQKRTESITSPST